MAMKVEELRQPYSYKPLTVADVAADPMEQFKSWFSKARELSEKERPNAMTLATATPEGVPSARIVLLKEVDEQGLIFYTNYKSRKARELADNPYAALVFWWPVLERQVRVQGQVERISAEASNRYFAVRPRGSQIGAWASQQSAVIKSRQELADQVEVVTEKYVNQEVPRPPHWGGYRLCPTAFEFWQGAPSRLHDRIYYQKKENEKGWAIKRLAP